MEDAQLDARRETVVVPVVTMVETVMPTVAETNALLASLKETEAKFARGEFVTYREGTFLEDMRARFKELRNRNPAC